MLIGMPKSIASMGAYHFWTRTDLVQLTESQKQFATNAEAIEGLIEQNVLRARSRLLETPAQGSA